MPKTIIIGDTDEYWDPISEKFVKPFKSSIEIEHSLYAISKWESKYRRSFFKENERPTSYEEIVDYIKFMTISENVDEETYKHVTWENINEVFEYMNEQFTATKIKKRNSKRSTGTYITNELVYYWMSFYGIPFECQHWHFSRLLTLIEVANEQNAPAGKMSKSATAKSFAELNELRRLQFGTHG